MQEFETPEGYDSYSPDRNDQIEAEAPKSYMDYVRDDLYQEISDYSSGKDVGCLSTMLMFAIGGAGLIYMLAVILT